MRDSTSVSEPRRKDTGLRCFLSHSEANINTVKYRYMLILLSPHLKGYPAEGLVVCSNVKVNRRVLVRSCGAAAVHARGGERQRAQLYPV